MDEQHLEYNLEMIEHNLLRLVDIDDDVLSETPPTNRKKTNGSLIEGHLSINGFASEYASVSPATWSMHNQDTFSNSMAKLDTEICNMQLTKNVSVYGLHKVLKGLNGTLQRSNETSNYGLNIGQNRMIQQPGVRVLIEFQLAYEYLAELAARRLETHRSDNKPFNFYSKIPLKLIWTHFLHSATEEYIKVSRVTVSLERMCETISEQNVLVQFQWALHGLQKSGQMKILQITAGNHKGADHDDANRLIEILDEVIVAFRKSSTHIWMLRTLIEKPSTPMDPRPGDQRLRENRKPRNRRIG